MRDGRELAFGLLICALLAPFCALGAVVFLWMDVHVVSVLFLALWLWVAGNVIVNLTVEEKDHEV